MILRGKKRRHYIRSTLVETERVMKDEVFCMQSFNSLGGRLPSSGYAKKGGGKVRQATILKGEKKRARNAKLLSTVREKEGGDLFNRGQREEKKGGVPVHYLSERRRGGRRSKEFLRGRSLEEKEDIGICVLVSEGEKKCS